jgi:hypothetical protein
MKRAILECDKLMPDGERSTTFEQLSTLTFEEKKGSPANYCNSH